jgi:YbbR domain-containing protein
MADFFRRYVLHNLGLKLLALLLAVGLWRVVRRDLAAEVEYSVPIEFHHVPDNLEIASERVPEARVRVRGPERLIRSMSAADLQVAIDLARAKPGERTFDLNSQDVHAPHDLEVVQIVPGQFHIVFDTRVTRQVPVKPRVVGSFAPGMEVAEVAADPAVITISGPKEHVDAVEAATTDPVDVSGTMEQASFTTHAYIADTLIQVVRPSSVRVTVMVVKIPSSRDKQAPAGQR